MSENVSQNSFEEVVYQVGDLVEKTGGEYEFVGTVVAAFDKLAGHRRYVVEDDRRALHIYSSKNLRLQRKPRND